MGAAVALVSLLAGCSSTASPPPRGPVTVTATATVTAAAPTVTVTPAPETVTAAPRPPTGSSPALDSLAALPVKGRAPRTGYDRAMFGQAWTDDTDEAGGRNGCDTRNDVLRRDLTATTVKAGTSGCVVLTGTLTDPYTGQMVDFVRGPNTSAAVQVDHVVALSNAWQTGAQQLGPRDRQNFANDPMNLITTLGSVNASKGAGDAATWLPPRKAIRCDYAARQVAVKARHRLWVTPPERDALQRILSGCPGQELPSGAMTQTPPTKG